MIKTLSSAWSFDNHIGIDYHQRPPHSGMMTPDDLHQFGLAHIQMQLVAPSILWESDIAGWNTHNFSMVDLLGMLIFQLC